MTHHVRNIETLTDEQNRQLTSYLKKADRQEESHDDVQPDFPVHPSAKKRATKDQNDRRSGRTRERHGTWTTNKRHSTEPSNEGPDVQQGVVNAIIVQDPKHYGEEIEREHRKQWLAANTKESDASMSNDVWAVVMPPKGVHALHNKWVFENKTDANEDIER